MSNSMAAPTNAELRGVFSDEEDTPQNYAILRKLAESKNYDVNEMAEACAPFITERIMEIVDDFFYQEVKDHEKVILEKDEEYPQGVFLRIEDRDPDEYTTDILLPHAMIPLIVPQPDQPLKWSEILENYQQNNDKLAILLTDYVLEFFAEELQLTVRLLKDGLTDQQLFDLNNEEDSLEFEIQNEAKTNSPRPTP